MSEEIKRSCRENILIYYFQNVFSNIATRKVKQIYKQNANKMPIRFNSFQNRNLGNNISMHILWLATVWNSIQKKYEKLDSGEVFWSLF